jgi:hypothetical protein
MQFLGGRRIFSIHEHHEVSVGGKERYLTFRIATVCALRVGFDEFSDRQAICSFTGRDCDVFPHGCSPYPVALARQHLLLEDGSWFEKRLDSVSAILTADAGIFESASWSLRIIRHVVDHHCAPTAAAIDGTNNFVHQ